MNVDNQTIVHVKAGHQAPMQLMSCILAKKPNVWGVAIQDVEADGPELAIQREDATNLTIDDIKTLMENAKDRPLTMYFGKLKDGYHLDDIQPFIINDGNDQPFITVFIEGTVVNNDEPAERTEQANFADKIIIPQILEWCADFEGDLDKITKKIGSEIFNNNLMAHVGHRAVIHIMPFDGEVITISKNELGEDDAEWGFTSQHHDYKAVKEQEPKAAEPEKKNKFFAKKSTPTAAAAPAKKDNPPGVHTVGATTVIDTKVRDAATPGTEDRPVTGKAEPLVMRVPSWLHKNGDVKLFYQLTDGHFEKDDFKVGQIPGSWKKRQPVIVRDPRVAEAAPKWNSVDDMHKFHLASRKMATAAPLPQETKPVEQPQAVPQDTNIPLIPAKELEKVLDLVAKLDGNSKEMIDPKEYKDFEKMHKLFSESVGLKNIGETFNWPVSGVRAIGVTDINALWVYALELRAHLRQAVAKGYVIGELDHKKIVTTETKIGDNGKKVESVDKTPLPVKVEKKGGFFAKKTAA